ncbi:hypothetical protein [Rhodococcus opacus]|uniref:Uncharacterized protein n=1 Tax=Rhodococcus opacus TaxID=37919 RepID=A0A2S8JAW1_RHOOP|nr:hypothetical protein [Rhodococcus opacus]PQP24186.1 hypothetical protein C5613_15000 [Rhodococcus opacus]
MKIIASFVGLLTVLWVVANLSAVLGAVAVVGGIVGLLFLLVRGGELAVERRRQAVQARRDEQLGLIYRATRQHELFLSGDPRGVFGDYPPAV